VPAVVLVAQGLEGGDVLALAARFLEDLAEVGRDYGIGGED
jgi:hypothetical protein